jgi:hypothetical protein
MVCVSLSIPDVQKRILGLRKTAIKLIEAGRVGMK